MYCENILCSFKVTLKRYVACETLWINAEKPDIECRIWKFVDDCMLTRNYKNMHRNSYLLNVAFDVLLCIVGFWRQSHRR